MLGGVRWTPQKWPYVDRHYFLGFDDEIFLFPFFIFSFLLSKDKNKKCIFSKTCFWHPDKQPKNYFRTPTHYLWFLRYPQNTMKLGKNKQKNLGPSFDPTLDQVSTHKNPKSWTKFWLYSTYTHTYIYIWGNALRFWAQKMFFVTKTRGKRVFGPKKVRPNLGTLLFWTFLHTWAITLYINDNQIEMNSFKRAPFNRILGTKGISHCIKNPEFNTTAKRGTFSRKCASFSCHVEYVESCWIRV